MMCRECGKEIEPVEAMRKKDEEVCMECVFKKVALPLGEITGVPQRKEDKSNADKNKKREILRSVVHTR